MKYRNTNVIRVHHDCDGVLRNFMDYALFVFFKHYPEYKKYLLLPKDAVGYNFSDNFSYPDKDKIDQILSYICFENQNTSYEIFLNAPSLISKFEWDKHCSILHENNCIVVISSHQYTTTAKIATLKWFDINNFSYDGIIFDNDGNKHLYDADFIIDDKIKMIDYFNSIRKQGGGVLYYNLRSNNNYKGNSPMVYNLEEFRNIIFKKDLYVKMSK